MENENDKLINKEENIKTKQEDESDVFDNYYCCALVTIIVLICMCLLVLVFYLVATDK